jgi:hypothetical protein
MANPFATSSQTSRFFKFESFRKNPGYVLSAGENDANLGFIPGTLTTRSGKRKTKKRTGLMSILRRFGKIEDFSPILQDMCHRT